MTGLVTAALGVVRHYTGSVAWASAVRASRVAVLSILQRLEVGQLLVKERDGTETRCGAEKGAGGDRWPQTELKIWTEAFWLRMAVFADMVRWPGLVIVAS